MKTTLVLATCVILIGNISWAIPTPPHLETDAKNDKRALSGFFYINPSEDNLNLRTRGAGEGNGDSQSINPHSTTVSNKAYYISNEGISKAKAKHGDVTDIQQKRPYINQKEPYVEKRAKSSPLLNRNHDQTEAFHPTQNVVTPNGIINPALRSQVPQQQGQIKSDQTQQAQQPRFPTVTTDPFFITLGNPQQPIAPMSHIKPVVAPVQSVNQQSNNAEYLSDETTELGELLGAYFNAVSEPDMTIIDNDSSAHDDFISKLPESAINNPWVKAYLSTEKYDMQYQGTYYLSEKDSGFYINSLLRWISYHKEFIHHVNAIIDLYAELEEYKASKQNKDIVKNVLSEVKNRVMKDCSLLEPESVHIYENKNNDPQAAKDRAQKMIKMYSDKIAQIEGNSLEFRAEKQLLSHIKQRHVYQDMYIDCVGIKSLKGRSELYKFADRNFLTPFLKHIKLFYQISDDENAENRIARLNAVLQGFSTFEKVLNVL